MNDGQLVGKNLWRKPLRTTLLIVSIFIAFLLFGVLGSFDYAFNNATNRVSANRLVSNNKINFTVPLPYAYVDRVRRVDGVTAVSFRNWFGGYYQERKNFIVMFAVDPESYLDVYKGDIVIPEDQRQAFISDRTGIIVGKTLAEKFGFKLGDDVPISSSIYTNKNTGRQAWTFKVVGIFSAKDPNQPANTAYINYENFRLSATFGDGAIGSIVALTKSADQNDAVSKRIDALFENSSYETKTTDERAFFRAFIAQQGDINLIISLVVAAAFTAILMIVGNTMVMAVRERTKEIGVMKTLGFSDGRIMRMVLSESLQLSLIGAAVGLGFGALVLSVMAVVLRDQFPGIHMPWFILFAGAALALLFGLVTGAIPAYTALKLKIVDALGRK